jgi:hypothetical protein
MLRSLLVMVVLACGGKQDAAPQPISNVSTHPEPVAPPPTRDEKMLAKMREFRDAMCKCAAGDVACAMRVSDDMTRWAVNDPLAKEPPGEPAKQNPEAEQIGKEMGECMQRAMIQPDPSTP